MKNRILILNEGGRKFGYGHVARCVALSQVLERNGCVVQTLVNGDETISAILEGSSFELFNWLEHSAKVLGRIKDADAVIIDSYLASDEFYKFAARNTGLPIYIDDNCRLDYPRGVIVNGNIYATELQYKRHPAKEYLLGIKYLHLRRQFWEAPKKRISKKILNILITLGGSDALNMGGDILRLLKDDFMNVRKHLIVGKAFQSLEKIEKEENLNVELVFSPEASVLRDLMAKADMAITAGGQMLCELACMGVPMIACAVVDNQVNNVRAWAQAGVTQYAGSYEDKQEMMVGISKGLRVLMDQRVRKMSSVKGQSLVDGQGACRVSDFILDRIAEQ